MNNQSRNNNEEWSFEKYYAYTTQKLISLIELQAERHKIAFDIATKHFPNSTSRSRHELATRWEKTALQSYHLHSGHL